MKENLKKTVSVLLSLVMTLSVFAGLKVLPQAQAAAVGDVIQFGSYPQTKVGDDDPELLAALELRVLFRYR